MATLANKTSSEIARGAYHRFDVLQRIEHLVLLVSFALLGLTGLVQKFAAWPVSDATIQFLGGIEMTRQIHHVNATIMAILAAYHIVTVGYRVFVLRVRMSMLPTLSDLAEGWQDTRYKLGLDKIPAKFGRYNYGEKMEYWAMVWGTFVMGLTGFMLWNPISTVRLVPGEWIPAAKAAHGAEAILAVLAIILWHFYNVHIKMFNKAMLTGKLDEHQMAHEHGRELEAIARGTAGRKIDPPVLRRRQLIYFPIATVMGMVLAFGIYKFVTLENTAPIKTVPPAVNVAVLVTATPQPTPTRAPTAVPTPAPTKAPAAGGQVTFVKDIQPLFAAKCAACHGSLGGLTLTSFESVMHGGTSGPAITPKDPAKSSLITKQTAGGHPGQLTAEEIELVRKWIADGAAEQ